MKYIRISFIIALIALIAGCGDVTVNVDNDYEPKIVVDGYIFPGQPVREIRLTRNYALNEDIALDEYVLTDATVTLTDVASGQTVPLQFSEDTENFGYDGPDDFIIQPGKSYKLYAEAVVSGKPLWTSSTTTVPEAGFAINRAASNLAPMTYRQNDEHGELMRREIVFERSPSITQYPASIIALDASESTFITENAFGFPEDQLFEDNNFELLKYQNMWYEEQKGAGQSGIDIEWFSIWFYGRYRLILYAADQNFTDYFITHQQIQDIDGNLWEPVFHFEGDGIGVFGSAIADTVYFEITR